jgi:hypothetical protein
MESNEVAVAAQWRQFVADAMAAPPAAITRREIRAPWQLPGKATAVIGMRRAGKTTFLWQCLAGPAPSWTACCITLKPSRSKASFSTPLKAGQDIPATASLVASTLAGLGNFHWRQAATAAITAKGKPENIAAPR